jgi:hypothetical protein
MDFDINEILADMLNAVEGEVKDNWKNVKDAASTFLQYRKERLSLLAELRLNNEIDQDFFERRLADEAKILESELHSIAIISKAIAQKAANAAIEVLQKAITAAIKI